MKYSKRKKTTTARKVVKKAVRKAKTQQLTKFIKRVVQRTEEKKINSFVTTLTNLGAVTNSTFSINNIFPITPYPTVGISITQGVGQGDRVGNRVRVVSSILRYTIFPKPYDSLLNATPQPQDVRLWFFSIKNTNDIPTTNPTDFVQSGSGSQALTGTIRDLNRVMNTDQFTYLGHRTHKVGIAAWVTTPGLSSNYGAYSNNDYKFNVQGYINLTRMIPKVIKYDDTDTVPTSKACFCLVEAVNADGTSQGVNTYPCTMTYQITMRYTDV